MMRITLPNPVNPRQASSSKQKQPMPSEILELLGVEALNVDSMVSPFDWLDPFGNILDCPWESAINSCEWRA
jgi:hypothetical protein